MKLPKKYAYIPFLVLVAGILGTALRAVLYATGPDEKGLLAAHHPLHILCLVLSVSVAVFLILTLGKLKSGNSYQEAFPPTKQAIVPAVLAALWFLVSAVFTLDLADDRMDMVWAVLGFAAVPCVLFSGYCSLTGKRPLFLCHGLICVFFAADMICRYRIWSGNPQVPDYCFHLFASIFLILTAYHRTAFDVGLGRRRMFLFCSLMATFLCMLALVGPDQNDFYFGGAFWAVSNLAPLTTSGTRHSRPDINPQEEA